MNRGRINRVLAVLILALVAADWGTKVWITNSLALGETLALVDGWFYFVHRHNPGVAFSLLSDLPDTYRIPLLTSLSLVGVVLFARIILSTADRWTQVAAAAVVAGALGNMGERVFLGGVTDFLFLPFFPFVFNVADTAITLGAVALAIRMMMSESAAAEPAGAQPV